MYSRVENYDDVRYRLSMVKLQPHSITVGSTTPTSYRLSMVKLQQKLVRFWTAMIGKLPLEHGEVATEEAGYRFTSVQKVTA